MYNDVEAKVKDAHYCFLNVVYCNDSGPVLCELVLSDENFVNVALLRISLSELKELDGKTGAVRDWFFDGDYLKCNAEVDEIPITSVVMETAGRILEYSGDGCGNLFEFLRIGEEYGCLVITGNVAKSQGDWEGAEITPFRRIHFSTSTMTCYTPMFSDKGLRNLMLVTIDDGVLNMHEFYYAVPEDSVQQIVSSGYVLPGELICRKLINGVNYRIYNSGTMPVYENSMILSKPLINKAVNMRMRFNDLVQMAKRFINGFLSQFTTRDDGVKWAGGDKDYRTSYGVYFRPARKPISAKVLDSLIQTCVRDIMSKCDSVKEAMAAVDALELTRDGSFVAKAFIASLFASHDNKTDFMLAGVTLLQDSNERDLFYTDLFLYRVRVYMYLTRYVFPGFGYNSRVLYGGCEPNVTVIEEVFYEQPI